MKLRYLTSLVLILTSLTAFCQKELLTKSQSEKIFNSAVKKQFDIEFPVYKAYLYTDTTGKSYVALAEQFDGVEGKDTVHHKIKAVNIRIIDGHLVKQWEINDFTNKIDQSSDMEKSIWFWTKYSSFTDIDKDGIVDPFIVYGTEGINGHDDGRIKLIIVYKGEKIAIRHQNGVIDEARNTQVDPKFYKLPTVIQEHVKAAMKKIMENNKGIFPNGWEKNMKNKKTKFSETSAN